MNTVDEATSSRSILKNTAALALSKVIYRGTTVVISVLVGRALGPAALGIYSTALVFQGLVALAAVMGASNYLVREIARDKSRTGAYLLHIGLLGTVTALAGTALSMLMVSHLGYSAQLTAAVKVIVLALVPGVLCSVQEAVFVAHQRVAFVTYTGCLAAVVYSGVSLYLLSRGLGVLSLVIAFVIMQYVQSACYACLIRKYIVPSYPRFDFAFALTTVRDMKTFAAMSILGGLLGRPEVILLSLLSSEWEVGLYGAALRLVDMWQLVPQVYMTNVFPVLSRASSREGETPESVRDSCVTQLMAISLPVTLVTFAAAGPIINLVYGPKFPGSVVELRILSANIALASLMAILWRVLAARDEQEMVLRAQLWVAGLRLSVGYVLIFLWSAVGAAISITFALVVHSMLLAWYVRRNGTRIRLVTLTWPIAAACLPVLALLTLPALRNHLLIGAPVLATVYLLVLVLLMRPQLRRALQTTSWIVR